MTDSTNIAFVKHRKCRLAFRLTYLHLTLVHSKCQGQGYGHFDSQTVKDMSSITIAIKYEVTYGLSINVFRFEIGPI